MTLFRRTWPATPRAALDALYRGEVFHLPANAASLALVDRARAELSGAVSAALGEGVPFDVRQAHALLSPDAFFAAMGVVRRRIYLEPEGHELVRDVVASLGFDLASLAFDPARLRVIAHRGHENPAAAPVYTAHRDVWYGHPPSLVTWWLPLDDLAEEETFVFYPDSFARAVPNDSEVFDYAEWVRQGWSLKIGWQDPESSKKARYPGVVGAIEPGPAEGFSCRRGDVLLFSGGHFHGTRPQATGRTRYSLDFRTVDLDDARVGRGAPNVDDRSRGSALPDYVQGARLAARG